MATAAAKAQRNGGQARSVLRARLEARRGEIEEAALTRVEAIADPDEVSDPIYAEGLRAAVVAALDYGLEAIERANSSTLPVPVALLAQARLAARNGISLDTVLRRYFAGYSLFGYFLLEEVGRNRLMSTSELQRLVGSQAGIFDRLLAAIGEEHDRESNARLSISRSWQAERIVRLLAGEMIDTADIAYDFDSWHLGTIACGPDACEAVRCLAGSRDCRLLKVERESDVIWAWFGTPDAFTLDRLGSTPMPDNATVALGEPGQGLAGWRLTHRQAATTLPVARRDPEPVVRYADVALFAAALRDEVLADSLRELYLSRLGQERDGGRTAKETLRAYFAANRNVSSTAAALGVRWHTIASRLRMIEASIDRPIDSCAAELEIALWLEGA